MRLLANGPVPVARAMLLDAPGRRGQHPGHEPPPAGPHPGHGPEDVMGEARISLVGVPDPVTGQGAWLVAGQRVREMDAVVVAVALGVVVVLVTGGHSGPRRVFPGRGGGDAVE